VLLASGLMEGGSVEARARLARFWRRMSAVSAFRAPAVVEAATRMLSPYQFNPFNLNPLRDALVEEVDFARLRAQSPVKLLVAVTRVRDGRPRIFREHELTVEAVLASACLPLLHHTVEIDGEAYWDGGYVANPPLLALASVSDAAHLLAVLVTPNVVDRTPVLRPDIIRRLDQIQFNATTNAEFEALRLGSMARTAPQSDGLQLSRISADDEYAGLAHASASDLDWDFLERLRQSGHAAASNWLAGQEPGSGYSGHTGYDQG
jgi:NTE family protein